MIPSTHHLRRLSQILISVCLLTFSAWSQPTLAEEVKLKVGIVLPLSGDYGSIGSRVREGIELYVKHSSPALSLVIEDGGSMEPRRLLTAANKLLEVDKVQVLSVMIIDDAQPLAPLTERRGIPLVVLWDGNKELLSKGKSIFSVGYQTETTALVLARAATQGERRRIAVVGEISPWAEVISANFKQEIESRRGTLVASEMLASGISDFSSIITKLKSKKPDSVLLALNFSGSTATFLKQAKSLGLSARFLTGEAFVGDGMKLAGDAAEGVYSVWAASPQLSTVSSQVPPEILASPIESGPLGVGYDGIAALATALKEKGQTPRDKLENFLGPSHSLNKEIALFKFQQGHMVLEARE